jgi:hypothetical protein
MERDARRRRGNRPLVICNLKQGIGLAEITAFIERAGMLQKTPDGSPIRPRPRPASAGGEESDDDDENDRKPKRQK